MAAVPVCGIAVKTQGDGCALHTTGAWSVWAVLSRVIGPREARCRWRPRAVDRRLPDQGSLVARSAVGASP